MSDPDAATDPLRPTARPARADERRHRTMLRQLISAIAALALIGGLSAGGAATAALAAGAQVSQRRAATDTQADAVRAALVDLRGVLDTNRTTALGDAGSGGLRLGALDASGRMAVLDVVRALLSDEGYERVIALMAADDALDTAAGGGTVFSSDDYALTVISDDAAGVTFVQFAGRHLAIDATVSGDAVTVEPEFLEG